MTTNQEWLSYWIKERWNILQEKKAGNPAPWSGDKIFQETYFTNVDREEDKVTKWIRQNWSYPYAPNFVLSLIVARVFNLPETLSEIGSPALKNFEEWLWVSEEVLEERRARGDNLWNGAYIVSTNGRSIDKLTHCLDIFQRAYDFGIDKKIKSCNTLQEAHNILVQVYGLSDFMSAQVVADLKNTSGYHLEDAEDWGTFVAPGPGSIRGLEWFFEEKITKKNFKEKINEAKEILEFELPDKILDILCMQNLQNCFCEFDKFMRIKNGTGRSKRKYDGAK